MIVYRNRCKTILLLVAVATLLPTRCALAVKPEDVIGDWTVFVYRSGAIQVASLKIRDESGELRATVSNDLGEARLRDASIDEDALLLRYEVPIGERSQKVLLALWPDNEDLSGTVSSGDGDPEANLLIKAARVGTPMESSLSDEHVAGQTNAADGVARLSADEARDFLGAWKISIGRANDENARQGQMGLVIVDDDGRVAAGVKLMDGVQRTIYQISKIDGGLRLAYALELGGTIPFNMDVVRNGEGLKMTMTPSGGTTFLEGTGVRAGGADELGMDASIVSQDPKVVLVGILGDYARVVGVHEKTVFLKEGPRLTALNTTDPLLIRFEQCRLPEKRIIISGDDSHVTAFDRESSSLEVYDVSDPKAMPKIGSCSIPGDSRTKFAARGATLFAVTVNGYTSTHQVRAVDLSDPSRPTVVSSSEPLKGSSLYDVHATDTHLFVGSSRLFSIVDLSESLSLRGVGSYKEGVGATRGIDVSGSIAYLAKSLHSDASYLKLVSIANPENPVEIGSCRTGGGTQDVAVSGSVAFVADRANGLVMIDVSDPANLRPCGYFRIAGLSKNVTVVGPLVFLEVMDVIGRDNKLAILRYAP